MKEIEGQLDIYDCIALAEEEAAQSITQTPYFDGEGNEGIIDEVYS